VSNGEFVMGVTYDNYTESSISIHGRCDIPGKVSREFYWAIFNYPFNQLKVKRLTALVSTANVKSQRLVEHLGFERETILKDYLKDGDGIIYIMRPETCRFLKLGDRYAKKVN
jgi:ribosomal protein S18 acetylase RimI-like enzyme